SDGAQAENAGPSTFTLTSSATVEPSANLTVSYRAASEVGDTATAGSDYVSTSSGSVPFTGTSGVISVPLIDDSNVEGNETFTVTLTGTSDSDVTASASARATITDDDTASLSIDDVTVSEGDGTVQFTVSSDRYIESSATVTVDFATQDDTAVAGEDYTATTGNLAISDGDRTTFTVPILEDSPAIVEGDETFNVLLSNTSTNAGIADGTGTATITDNDVPDISISDAAAVAEGNGTDTPVSFLVSSSLPVAANASLTVTYAVSAGTTEADDFSGSTSGTVTISNGSTATIPLTYAGDRIVETDEHYTVELSNPVISSSSVVPVLLDPSGSGVILNDDSPQLTIDDVAKSEGDSGTTTMTFTVTSDLQVASDAAVNFDYAVNAVDTEPGDLSGTLAGSVTLSGGNTAQIAVDVAGDVTVEPDETYTVDISNPTIPSSTAGASIVDSSGLGTILNDDSFTVSIDATLKSALEDMGPLVWTVTLSNPVEWQVEVPYTFNAGSADTALEGSDYTDAASSPLVFAPGTTSQDITINLVNDTVIEPDETFTITLDTPSPATSGSLGNRVGTGEILNDEHLITMSAGSQGTLSTAYGGGASISDGTTTVQVDHEATPAFDVAITDTCFHIDDLSVDGVSQGAVSSYTFAPVTTDHSISVDFARNTYTITATVLGSHGTLTPTQTVPCGSSGYAYIAQAESGYHISWLKVNGADVPAAAGQESYTYTFGTITSDQTIEVAYTQLITVTEDSPFGDITPAAGKVPIEVNYGDNLTFDITAASSCPNGLGHDGQVHHISDVIVDGASVPGVKGSGLTTYSYTFSNITSDHSIEALFTSYIDMTVNGNGTTDPLGVTTTGSLEVDAHDSPTITAVPDPGFHVSAVEIDGTPVGQPESYTFSDMYDEDHTYEVWFSIDTFTLKPVSRFGTVYDTAAQSVVATDREVSYHDTSSFYVDLDDPDHSVMGILIDNISYPIPAAGDTVIYPAFTLINNADDYLEVRFTNVEVGHRLEVQDYDTSPISDVPLDARLRPKPASLMFVLDDSGSMDWEFIVPGNGLFNGRYYVYSYPTVDAARVYSNNSIQANGEQDEWRSQWAGVNKMFYNPDVEYVPWPTFTGTPSSNLPAADSSIAGQADGQAHANIYRPRYHPWHSQDCTEALNKALGKTPDNLANCSNTETFDMDGTFLSLDGASDDHGDTIGTATPVSLNNSYTADLETAGDHDVFRIELTSPGDLLVRTLRTSECTDTEARILDSSGNTYRYSDYAPYNQYLDNPYADDCGPDSWCDLSCGRDQDPYIFLTNVPAGTYYIDVRGYGNRTGTYILDLAFTGSSNTFPNPPPPSKGIINAHYFTWEDVNGNGVIDFVDSNHNGQLDVNETVNENIWLVNLTDPIEYYRVLDNSQNVSAANLQRVDADKVPATVKTFASPTDPDAWRKERQNWADWFSYYRKRIYSATAAVARVIARMEDIEVGYRTINYRNGGYENGGYGFSQSVLPVKVSGVGDQTNRLLEILYDFQIDAYGTPLRNGLNAVGQYYDDTDGGADGGIGTSPFHAREDGDECKQAFTIVMTDGYWNGDSPGVGNADGDNGAPYADGFSNTLADVAMHYFEKDLSTLDDLVPDGTNTHQHMITYTVAFGVNGTLNPDDYDFKNGVYPDWPNPTSSDEARVDDLWHAAVNGHGKYMNAARPDELVASLLDIMTDIGSRIGSGASVSVNGDEMYENVNGQVRMFQTTYNSGDWHGDLRAYQLNTTTGEVLKNSPVWSAEEKLRNLLMTSGPDARIIATYDGHKGVPFRWLDGYGNPYLAAWQQKMLQPYFAQSLTAEDMLNYLRGDASNEGSLRDRDPQHPLGDFVHSQARFEDGILYVGGNDGMLHAFSATDANGGEELFAYVPGLVYQNLRELGDPLYGHKFYVDNTPYTKKIGDTTLLVGGLGKGGKGYYCLNITDAGSISSEADLASRVLWEYPAPPATLVSGTTFTFSSGTGTNGADEIRDSAHGFTAANGFEVGRWITVIGANYNDGSNSGSNDGTYRIKAVAGDGSAIELEAGSLINGYGDGEDITITAATSDRDMGYSFSKAYIVKTYDSTINAGTDLEGYVVIFGNGYSSENGNAVLYILNPLDGSVIKKIKTRVGPFNGLSTPKIVDVNNDLKADYVYAGDLLGNMWKFDLTSSDHADWQVAFCDNASPTDHCKDTDDLDDTDDPVPSFTAEPLFGGLANQAITGAPDVMFHRGGPGYMVIFGTGKYIGEPDLTNFAVQSLYGIWDWAPDNTDDGYNGVRVDTVTTPSVATLSNWPETDTSGGQATHTLLKQVIRVEGVITEDTDGDGHLDVDEDLNKNGVLDPGEDVDGDGRLDVEEDSNGNKEIDTYSYYRIPSDYKGDWDTIATKDLPPGHRFYNRDLNGDGSVDDHDRIPVANVGWYFDLPGKLDLVGDGQDNDKDGLVDEDDNGDDIIDERMPGERVVSDTIIRDGKAIMISFGVTGTRCNAGAYSFVNERDPDTGGMLEQPAFDVDGDGEVNGNDAYYIRVNEDVNGDGKIDDNDVVRGVPTDKSYEGRLHNPAILRESTQSGDDHPEETKYFSSSGGTIETLTERAERRGVYFWQQVE
ncbi:MAG TPA: hypothetical protein ENI89_05315, partial [Desulfobulbus sp.]|nr:hypothetical protein [Desulfobulbus sp.]